jgi:hypothetical protein
MLLLILEFHKNRYKQGLTFRTGIDKNIFTHVTVKFHGILKVKNALVKSAHHVTECTICILVLFMA